MIKGNLEEYKYDKLITLNGIIAMFFSSPL
jgi:hypothetical protein